MSRKHRHWQFSQCVFLLSYFVFGPGEGRGQLPDFADQLPRIAPRSPEESMRSMHIADGYQVQLVASEPNVHDPVAIAFDEAARMYVVEMCDYSEQETEQLGNIRLLEDKDHDGMYESSTLFADTLSWPTAIAVYNGGVFVGAAPDIWFLKDENGDGKADVKKKVFTGFGRSNVQGLMNSFCWGLDCRLYGQTSSSGASITRPDNPDTKPVALSGRDFSFDPKLLDLRAESGGGQHGMSFDDWGNRFTCHNSDHLQLHLYEDRYQLADNLLPLPPTRQSIAVDGPQANVFRRSEVEPWRILRTNLRVTKQVAGIVEGGGRPSGYFTSATGITIYRGDAMPELSGLAFVGDVGSNIIHRKKLTRDGITMKGERIDVESEFLASSDIWFRPVQFANAPDGSLVVLDLYREVIEHPKSLPQEIKKHLDLTSGRDRGRIYRIVSRELAVQRDNDLSRLSTEQLVALLVHPNAWHRETASRCLVQRVELNPNLDQSAKSKLLKQIESVAKEAKSRAGGLQCLGLLSHLGHVPSDLATWFESADPQARRSSIRLLEPLAANDEALRKWIYKLAGDDDDSVRFQVALTLSVLPLQQSELAERQAAARKLMMGSHQNAWLEAAAGNAAKSHLPTIIEEFLSSTGAGQGGASDWNRESSLLLGRLFATMASESQLKLVDSELAAEQRSDNRRALMEGCLRGLATKSRYDSQVLSNFPFFKKTISDAILIAKSDLSIEHNDAPKKLAAIESLRWNKSNESAALLLQALDQRESATVQAAALDAIAPYNDAETASRLIDRYPSLSPTLRSRTIDLLFTKKPWLQTLVRRAGEGGFDLRDLDPSRRNALQQHADPEIRAVASKILGAASNDSRAQVLARYRDVPKMTGNADAGKVHFNKICATCHKYEGIGFELGPNLSTFKYRGAEAILENVLDPNREVNPQYVSYTIQTTDERTVTGMVESESATSITLVRGDNARDVIPRSDIAQMKSSKLSIMPEGIENQIDPQSMADLLAFLLGK